MRILLVHNSYRQRGGEDAVYEAEVDLLRRAGHDVVEYRRHNHEIDGARPLRLFRRTIWSDEAYQELRDIAGDLKPEVAHFHNTLPLVSPAGYQAVRGVGVPVVQTLHNFRMICPSALLFRKGSTCEDCVGRRFAWPSILHGCYRQSRATTAAVATMLAFHRLRGTWSQDVDAYIALTSFARDELLAGGSLPADRMAILPNFLAEDPGCGETGERRGVLFVGRLAEEKGVRVLLQAAERMPSDVRLTIVGGGPLALEVHAAAARDARIRYLGEQPRHVVLEEMRRARVLAFPSMWFEGFPMTLVEAFASGLPVVASRIGSMASIVHEDHDGVTVRPGDPEELADALTAIEQDGAKAAGLSRRARAIFESRYAASVHLQGLLSIYQSAIESFASGESPRFDLSLLGPESIPALGANEGSAASDGQPVHG